ncbi:hypothetical protein [Kitasatospora griseola]|uniref:hypothetical protein n=1 Tax=Kitasatospora griseola TaxID=2064 RepID=UPI001670267E|nr:hypothetical protein [Kitasatospora griseola]GGQ66186.1 hypothetical protein GCM10010195_22300 [Kitasatospora griseola]
MDPVSAPARLAPLGDTGLWQAVMAAASGRCQCRGACGKSHAKHEGRCEREHGTHRTHAGGQVRLIAAPADPADLLLPDHQVAALPKNRLAAWCPACHHAAHTTARKAATAAQPPAEPDALF